MAEETGGEKTLPASQYKISKAREEGNVARSQDLTAAWSLLVALAALWVLGPDLFGVVLGATRYYFGNFSRFALDAGSFTHFTAEGVFITVRAVFPFVVVLLLAGTVMNFVQVGFLFAPKAIAPKFSRVNPFTGFKKFVTLRTAMELVKSILKLALVSAVVYVTVRGRWQEVVATSHLDPLPMTIALAKFVFMVWLRVALAMFVLGLLDFGFQKWQYGRDLMMTAQEAKEEVKQFEGDPRIKQRIRQIQRQMAMKRMMSEVPTADVVVTNPVRFAVALRYDMANMQAPVVVAKGARLLAKRIREIAEEHDVPVVEKPDLARALFKSIEVGQPVPENLFRAVAEVLAFVYRIDRREEKIRERAAFALNPAGAP
ncbi:MAG: flagellar biosynthetic protein FlhB [Candidatus Hydrogenedentota bacterium]